MKSSGRDEVQVVKKSILVTGANGQLGNEVRKAAKSLPKFNFHFTSRAELSLKNPDELQSAFDGQYHYCINCAAYTAVDKAEEQEEEAFAINATAVETLGILSKAHRTKLIHISTDYVFDGNSESPWKEEDKVSPLNVYGRSKLKGEELLLNKNPNALIIRTSWVYSSFGNNFVKTILRLCAGKDTLNVIDDQYGCPTYAANIAGVIFQAIRQSEEGQQLSGILHYCDDGATTWFNFALAIRDLAGLSCDIQPIHAAQYKTAAQRPKYSVLDTSKIRNLLDWYIPAWKESLAECIKEIKSAT